MAGDSAGGKEVGRLSIRIVPDLKRFRASLQAELEEIERTMKATIEVDVDLDADGAKGRLRALLAELRATAARGVQVPVNYDKPGPIPVPSGGGGGGGLAGAGAGLLNPGVLAAVAAGILFLAGPTVGLLTTALLTIPGVIATIAAPIAAITLGLDGMKKAAGVLKAPFDQLKATMSAVNEKAFTPVFEKLGKLMPSLSNYLPAVSRGLATIGDSIADAFTNPENITKVERSLLNIGEGLRRAAPGIGDFTSGIITLVDEFTKKFPSIGDFLSGTGKDFKTWIDNLAKDGTLSTAFGTLGDTVKTILEALGKLGKAGLEFMKDPKNLDEFLAAIGKIGDGLKILVDLSTKVNSFLSKPIAMNALNGNAFDAIKTVVLGIIGLLAGVPIAISTAFSALSGTVSTAFAGVSGVVSGVFNFIVGLFSTIPAALGSAFSGLAGIASSSFGAIVGAISGAMSNALGAVVQGVGQIVGEVAGLGAKVAGAVGNLGSALVGAGVALMGGLLTGIKSALGSVLSFASGIAAKIAAVKGPLSYDKTVLTPNGQALMQGLQTGIEGGLTGVLDRAKSIAGQLSEAINTGGTIQVDGLKDQIKRAMDELTLESKQLKVDYDAIPKEDKAGRKNNQDQRAQVQSLKNQLSLQSDQLGFSQKYGDEIAGVSTSWGDISKKMADIGTGFAKAVGQDTASTLGIGGNGALQALGEYGIGLGQKFIFNVSNVDQAMTAKQTELNKQSLQYQRR